MERTWNEDYASGQLPWDSPEPDPDLIRFIQSGAVAPGRALDIGAGTGTNTLWLAEQGFDILGIDIAPLATEAARTKQAGRPLRCRFETIDFLTSPIPDGPYDLVFDRGCFHLFDGAEERARFASRVSELLASAGQWLSLLGSTEGAPREFGPPRRSARDIALAIEPALELVELRASEFTLPNGSAKSWVSVARRRDQPAQPSTIHDVVRR